MSESEKSSGSVSSSESSSLMSSSEASSLWSSISSSGSSSGISSSSGSSSQSSSLWSSISSSGSPSGISSSSGSSSSGSSSGSSTIYSYSIEFNYYTYGDPPSTITETVIVSGTDPEQMFGTNMLGAFQLFFSIGGAEWIIAMDDITPASGTGVLPDYGQLAGSHTDVSDPTGFYVEVGGAPFPNWTATVSAIP